MPRFFNIFLFEVLKRYADFKGRANREQYWFYFLSQVLLLTVLEILCLIPFIGVLFALATIVVGLGLLVPAVSIAVRRMHDQNKSGWFLLLGFIPFVGSIIILVFMCLKGTEGENRFGPAPEAQLYKN